jgi:hypothetical protein
MDLHSPAEERVVRVFISSTFLDMHDERDELIKHIFPQLRKLCEERGVTWAEVDLRWGVTDEQRAEGKVLPICLDEIERCRPYFIGILGERYGWVPKILPIELIQRYPWLNVSDSVTELEILHGALRNPGATQCAFFYFRDPFYAESHISEVRDRFLAESPLASAKLRSLKQRILQSKLPVRDNYPDPTTFGALLLEDSTRVINEHFPPLSAPGVVDRTAAEHEAFARSRAQFYIGANKYFPRLDDVVAHGPALIVIEGESGSGKTALMANWALKYRLEHPDDLLIPHFIDSSPESTDWSGMLRRIMGELSGRGVPVKR